jgi:hypothetical protein
VALIEIISQKYKQVKQTLVSFLKPFKVASWSLIRLKYVLKKGDPQSLINSGSTINS